MNPWKHPDCTCGPEVTRRKPGCPVEEFHHVFLEKLRKAALFRPQSVVHIERPHEAYTESPLELVSQEMWDYGDILRANPANRAHCGQPLSQDRGPMETVACVEDEPARIVQCDTCGMLFEVPEEAVV